MPEKKLCAHVRAASQPVPTLAEEINLRWEEEWDLGEVCYAMTAATRHLWVTQGERCERRKKQRVPVMARAKTKKDASRGDRLKKGRKRWNW